MLPAVLGGTTTERVTLSKRFATRLRETSLRRWGTGIGALALAVSGAFGGLKAVEAEPGPAVAADQVIDAGAYRITIKRVALSSEFPAIRLKDKKNHFIVVVATIEVTAKESWSLFREALKLRDVDGMVDKYPQVALFRDGKILGALQPGMPEDVAFFWERSGAIPKQANVWALGWTFRKSSLDGSRAAPQWLPDGEDEPRGRVTLPVLDRRTPATPTPSPSKS